MILRPKRCPARFAVLLESPLRRRLLGLERLVNSLPLRPRARMLDLGAGSGVVARAVLEREGGSRLVLVDAQQAMLRRARRRLGGGPGLVTAVAEDLPFGDETFDLVLMVTVLGEVDDAETALREVCRVLRPGGTLSVSEHLPDPDFRSLGKVRTLARVVELAEPEVRGNRWSYTANFMKADVTRKDRRAG